VNSKCPYSRPGFRRGTADTNLAALGAHCTVLDYSEKQLLNEKIVAEREHYDVDIVQADMTKPCPLKMNVLT
jgi:hypothetical protein